MSAMILRNNCKQLVRSTDQLVRHRNGLKQTHRHGSIVRHLTYGRNVRVVVTFVTITMHDAGFTDVRITQHENLVSGCEIKRHVCFRLLLNCCVPSRQESRRPRVVLSTLRRGGCWRIDSKPALFNLPLKLPSQSQLFKCHARNIVS